jgi:serine/threonine protein kinase
LTKPTGKLPHLPWNDYRAVSRLGSGGNGDVWLCEDDDGNQVAVKILSQFKGARYSRFGVEIKFLEGLSNTDGVVPLLRHHLPTEPDKTNPPCYAMPVAKPLNDRLPEDTPGIVRLVADLAAVLERLHQDGVTHRDIKPNNILWLDGWRFSDFGLVDFPGKEDITKAGEPVGAKWTIAPEMRRMAAASDGKAADVYSLAKTLWILLTGQWMGFDGQYNRDVSTLNIETYRECDYVRPIHALLEEATEYNPAERPTAHQFHTRLVEWLKATEDFHKRNLMEWEYMLRWLFPRRAPHRALWEDASEIAEILSLSVSTENLNHTFFPRVGGNDLCGATVVEGGLIELDLLGPHLARPRFLEIVQWPDEREWSYFWLQLDGLEPVGTDPPNDKSTSFYEELVELPDGRLLGRESLDQGGYHDDDGSFVKLPKGSRLLTRMLSGSLVIFAKRSPYNQDTATYDARHEKMGRDAFYRYIRAHVDWVRAGKKEVPKIPSVGFLPVGFHYRRTR